MAAWRGLSPLLLLLFVHSSHFGPALCWIIDLTLYCSWPAITPLGRWQRFLICCIIGIFWHKESGPLFLGTKRLALLIWLHLIRLSYFLACWCFQNVALLAFVFCSWHFVSQLCLYHLRAAFRYTARMKLVCFRTSNSSISIPSIPGMLLRLMIKTVIVFAGWRHVNLMHALVMFGSLQLNASNTQVKNKLRFGAIYFKVNCERTRSFCNRNLQTC